MTRLAGGARVFDIGLQEMMVIAVLVVLFFPPEDLPALFRTAGRWYAKMRRSSDELRRAFNVEVARAESELRMEELRARREAVRAAREANAADAADVQPEGSASVPSPRLPPGLVSAVAATPAPVASVSRPAGPGEPSPTPSDAA
jgi:sec-independent protein translocase protein TatB